MNFCAGRLHGGMLAAEHVKVVQLLVGKGSLDSHGVIPFLLNKYTLSILHFCGGNKWGFP